MTDAETIEALRALLTEANWKEPSVDQQPFDCGYNLAMMQVNRILNHEVLRPCG